MKKKKSSENDQSTGHFLSFFIYFFSSPDPKSEKKIPVNQLIKNFGLNKMQEYSSSDKKRRLSWPNFSQ